MPFVGTCTNTRALEFSASPTQADNVTPAQVDPSHPLRVVALDGNALSSAPHPDDPTNPLKCVAWMPDGFEGAVQCKAVLDADMGVDAGEGTAGYREISDPGIVTFHSPEAENVGTVVGGEVAKPA